MSMRLLKQLMRVLKLKLGYLNYRMNIQDGDTIMELITLESNEN